MDVVDRIKVAMLEDSISDDESLYRRVPDDVRFIKELPGETFRISSQAFYDRSQRISVDRAKLRENNPQQTLASYPGPAGVVSIKTGDVRAIHDLMHHDQTLGLTQKFEVDVEPAPILNDPNEPDNPAHAEICTKPKCPKKVFQILIERLALLVNSKEHKWLIEPPSIKNKL